ncbi:MAG: Tetratricopeptide 2 repeat protein [Gammaproteobacteria bacterium]|jgi:TolB-like protein/DNA-binding winged helix-turn-helix (wHTH) protein/Flp pilus assembly protein TadD|nr:Tetratricopeptide 2 repeat protein [Gammaproteobacteria bacterium]
MNDPVRYQVSDLTIDVGRGRVMRGGTEIALPKLSFELLLVLIRHAPNLLSLDALMDKVWPGLIVSPETVSQRVKLLRDALDDDPKAPRYIGGLRGRGYQLVAPVNPLAPELPPAIAAPAPPAVEAIRSDLHSSEVAVGEVADTGAPAALATATRAIPPVAQKSVDVASQTAAPETSTPVRTLGRKAPPYFWAAALVILIGGAALYFPLTRFADRGADGPQFRPPPHSVAVLSFVNMSGDAQQDYFSDGLSEELSDSLARIKDLRVAARTSSFTFKGKDVDIPTVARKLNVSTVLEGSVRKVGDRMRITAQLIDAITGFHLWSQTYERDLTDVFRLQSEIATAVSGALRITLLADEQEQLAPGGTRNVQAFDAYLRGRYGEAIQDETGLRGALAALDEAVGLDPQYAQALAFRADVMTQVAGMYTRDPKERERLMTAARTDVQKAVSLAPHSALAWSTLGTVLAITSPDYKAVDAAYRRSIELEPGNAEILHTYASYAAAFGRSDALIAARRAVSLDPLDLGAHANLGVVFFYAHQYSDARAAFQEALRLGTNRVTLNWLGLNELAAGHADSALKYCPDKDNWADQVCLAIAYHKLGRQSDADAMLAKAMAAQGDGAAYQYVEIYAAWGDIPHAMQWLKRAVELQDGGLLAVKTDPFLDPLRNMREFDALVAKIGLPT